MDAVIEFMINERNIAVGGAGLGFLSPSVVLTGVIDQQAHIVFNHEFVWGTGSGHGKEDIGLNLLVTQG